MLTIDKENSDSPDRTEPHPSLFKLACCFMATSWENIPAAIDALLAEMGARLWADRVYVVACDFETNRAVNTHLWCRDDIPGLTDGAPFSPLHAISDWVTRHRAGEAVVIDDVRTLPAGPLKTMLGEAGIKNLATVPIFHGYSLVGFLGADRIERERLFSPPDIHLMRSAGTLLSSLEYRRERSQAQRQAMDDLVALLIERDSEILKTKTALRRKAMEYEELNMALKALLDNREELFGPSSQTADHIRPFRLRA